MTSVSPTNGPMGYPEGPASAESRSPQQPVEPKTVAFELMLLDSPQYRSRLPMRVHIYPHDTTDSIVTTVKNFYGLYSGPNGSQAVSFEDDQGITLIARYENFRHNMTVYVRVIDETPVSAPYSTHTFHPAPLDGQPYYTGEAPVSRAEMHHSPDAARPDSRTSRGQSPAAGSHGHRSDSSNGRAHSARNGYPLANAHSHAYSDGYSSGEGGPASSSGRSKEHLGNTDISVENIVEGGRRKRAKFESSELPLFAPPQMPASTSNPSVSPARRIEHHHRLSLPMAQPGVNPFTNPQPMQSPQSYSHSMPQSMYATPNHAHRHSRGSVSYGSGNAMGILPTPDPTVGSTMSEEDKDVALQLMRLGDMSNISHGRTSASTLDDTFSGRADAASSTGATSDGESEVDDEPAARRQKLDHAGAARPVYQTIDAHFMPPPETTGIKMDGFADVKKSQPKTAIKKTHVPIPRPGGAKPKGPKPAATGAKAKKTAPAPDAVPMSPASVPPSRKHSITSSTQLSQAGDDDHPDLSTKPRCQRCRKSKKGCDRQRPCGRCKDAGLSADQCVSEDEGNGRKGRYGRHMGVPIKKEEGLVMQSALLPAAAISAAMAPMTGMPAAALDKAKKRKR